MFKSINLPKIIVMACLLFGALSVSAQSWAWGMGWSNDMYSSYILNEMIGDLAEENAREAGGHTSRSKAAKKSSSSSHKSKDIISPKSDLQALYFTPSAEGAQLALEKFMGNFSVPKNEKDKKEQEEMKIFFKTGQHKQPFNNIMRTYELSENNIADVLAVYLSLSWLITNNINLKKQFPDNGKKAINAVATKLKTYMASNQSITSQPDVLKQEETDALTMLIYFWDSADEEFAKGKGFKNSMNRALFNQYVYDAVKKYGFDLKKVRLTDQGFVPITGK